LSRFQFLVGGAGLTNFRKEENYKVNKGNYKNGISTVSDMLEAQAFLQQAKDQLTDAKANYIVKKAAYLLIKAR
jgi:outer membrane protein TolC